MEKSIQFGIEFRVRGKRQLDEATASVERFTKSTTSLDDAAKALSTLQNSVVNLRGANKHLSSTATGFDALHKSIAPDRVQQVDAMASALGRLNLQVAQMRGGGLAAGFNNVVSKPAATGSTQYTRARRYTLPVAPGFALMSADDQRALARANAASAWSPLAARARIRASASDARQLQPASIRSQMAGVAGGIWQGATSLFNTGNRAAFQAAGGVQGLTDKVNDLSVALHRAHTQFQGLGEAGMQLKTAGGVLALGGAGVVAADVGLANLAGNFKLTRRGIANLLPQGANADKFIGSIKQFDRNSTITDFNQSMDSAKMLLGSGVKQERVVPLLQKISDAVVFAGGNKENFDAVVTQFRQAASGANFTQRDVTALATSGGIPIMEILKAGLGEDRIKRMNQGESLTGDEALTGFEKGVYKFRGGAAQGANAKAVDTLPGQISNLTSALQQLGITIGEKLLPTVQLVTGWVTGLADFFTNLGQTAIGGLLLKVGALASLIGGGLAVALGSALIFIGNLLQALSFLGFASTAAAEANTAQAVSNTAVADTAGAAAIANRAQATSALAVGGAVGKLGIALKALKLAFAGFIGMKIGAAAYDSLFANGEDQPESGEAWENAKGRIGAFFRTGHSSNYDKEVNEKWAKDRADQKKLDALNDEREAKGLPSINLAQFRGKELKPEENPETRRETLKQQQAQLEQLKLQKEMQATVTAPAFSPSTNAPDVTFAEELGAMTGSKDDKMNLRQHKLAVRYRTKAQREAEKNAKLQANQAIANLDPADAALAASDSAQVRQLGDQLTVARRNGDKQLVAQLTDRIRNAKDFLGDVRKQDSQRKAVEHEAQRQAEVLHQEKMRAMQREAKALHGEAKKKKLQQIELERANWARQKVGLPGVGSGIVTGRGPMADYKVNLQKQIGGGEMSWAKHIIGQVSKGAALRLAHYGDGTNNGKRDLAFAEAYSERYGMFKGIGELRQRMVNTNARAISVGVGTAAAWNQDGSITLDILPKKITLPAAPDRTAAMF